jgi:hypothetical protein
VTEAPRDLDQEIAALVCNLPGAAMLHGDASGFEPGGVLFE